MIFIRRELSPYHCQGMPGPCTMRRKELFLLRHLENHLLTKSKLAAAAAQQEQAEKKITKQQQEEAEPDTKTNAQSKKKETPQSYSTTYFQQRNPIHRQESTNNATIALDISGFTPDQLEVALEDNVLSVFGKRQNRLGDTYVISRRFGLKESIYDETSIQANLSEGILELTLQKKPPAYKNKVRSIPITTSDKEVKPSLPMVEIQQDSKDEKEVAGVTEEPEQDGNGREKEESTTEEEEIIFQPSINAENEEEVTTEALDQEYHVQKGEFAPPQAEATQWSTTNVEVETVDELAKDDEVDEADAWQDLADES